MLFSIYFFFVTCTAKYIITELFSNSLGGVFLFNQVAESETLFFFFLMVVDILRLELRNAPEIHNICVVFAMLVLSKIEEPW